MDYSKLWPLGITIIYISFVLFLFVFVFYSGSQQVDLVTDNYYEQELKYQQQINRIERAQSLSQPVEWTHETKKRSLMIQFPSDIDHGRVQGNIWFFRPSDAKQDKMVVLNLSSDGTQFISTKNMSPGYWKLKIFWHINNNEYYKEDVLVIE